MKQAKILLTDALCALLFSLSTSFVLLPAMDLQAPGGLLLVSAAVLLGLFALGECFPRLVWGSLGAAAALGVVLAAVFSWWDVLQSYFLRAVGETLLEGGEPHFLVCLGAILPITLLFWLLMRRWPCLWAVTLISVMIIGCKVVFWPEGWVAPFLLACAGNILFLPRAVLQGEGRFQAQMLAALLAAPVLLFSLWAAPAEDGQRYSLALRHLVQDGQDFWEYHWGELPQLQVFSMRNMGLQPEEDRLGGDITLGQNTILTGSQDLLLRGQVLEFYNGLGWEDTPGQNSGNFRLNSLLWLGKKQEAFGLALSSQSDLPEGLLMRVDTELHHYRRTRAVFLPYRTERIQPMRSGLQLYFNTEGEVYWGQLPEEMPDYRVEGWSWNFRSKSFDKGMLLLEQQVSSSGEDRLYRQAAERCLQLPETLPDWVRELAQSLTEGCETPYQRAIALRNYLAQSCEYTLTPGHPDPEQDFVTAFLTEKRGYCTYYASALTVLCRCSGVPARYVTGYGMIPEKGRYKATQATAHAWTEIYLEKIGWVPLDALSQEIFLQNTPLPQQAQAGDRADALDFAPASDEEQTEMELPLEGGERGFNPWLLLWVLPALIGAGGLVGAARLRSARYRERYVSRNFPESIQAAEHCYAGLMRLLRLIRHRPAPGETLLAFWERTAELLPAQKESWREVGSIMNRMRFGGQAPSWEETALLCQAYGVLEGYIREVRGFWGWFIV